MYRIKLQNTVTNQEYTYDNVIDKNNGKKLYYNYNIDTSNLSDGEYKLTLFKGNDIVCTEILKVGDFNTDKIQYSKGANVFINAKPEIKLNELFEYGGGRWIADDNEAYKTVEVWNVIDCGLLNYKMHNLPHENFISNSPINKEWWGEYTMFTTETVTDFENFFVNCPNLHTIIVNADASTNMNNMIDTPENILELMIWNLGCSFSYSSYTNIDSSGVNYIKNTLYNVQEVWDKEETPTINLSKYITKVDENAIAAAVNKGWLIGGVNIFPEYSVNLNDQWRLSVEIPNPDTYSFDGVYESFSNWNVNGGTADMSIEIENKNEFTFYIRSYGESNYDYVEVYELDKEYTGNVYATTYSKPNSNTDIAAYQQVTFTNIPSGKHTIYIRYRKDGSANSGTDRGYVLIPKYQ